MKSAIEKLCLSKHPEGGFFRQFYKSSVKVQPHDQKNLRAAVTHIYYYLPKGSYSRFHKNRYDEIWNLYGGEGIRFFLYDAQKRIVTEEELKANLYKYHMVVPGGIWQAAEPIGEYALVGCSVAPGWEIQDEVYLLDDSQESKILFELKPEWARLINPA
jgi:predicted cupin superfamily sugar epimerase